MGGVLNFTKMNFKLILNLPNKIQTLSQPRPPITYLNSGKIYLDSLLLITTINPVQESDAIDLPMTFLPCQFGLLYSRPSP